MADFAEEFNRVFRVISSDNDFKPQTSEGYGRMIHGVSWEDVDAHFAGLRTIHLRLVSEQHTTYTGVWDFDGGEKDWPRVTALVAEMRRLGFQIPPVSLSGKKGFNVWLLLERPFPAAVVRKFLRDVLIHTFERYQPGYQRSVETRPDSDFANDSGKCTKALPFGKNQKSGNWTGLLDPALLSEQSPPPLGFCEFQGNPLQTQLLANVRFVSHEQFNGALASFESKQSQERVEQGLLKFDDFHEGEHPECITSILKDGAPTDLQYNTLNLTLFNYCRMRGMTRESSEGLARKVAEASDGHSTSKVTVDEKLANFRSNFGDGKKTPFSCGYVRQSEEWASRIDCKVCQAKACDDPLRWARYCPLAWRKEDVFGVFTEPELPSIPTPFPQLSEILVGGFRAGWLYTLLAPPKAGKTTLAANLLDHAARNGHPSLYAGYEMSFAQMVEYAMARTLRINSSRIARKHLSEHEAKMLADAVAGYVAHEGACLDIWEADQTHVLRGINYWVEDAKRRSQEKTPFVVVDYLHLVPTGNSDFDLTANETRRISALITAIKQIARTTQAAILVLSSVTKEAEASASREGNIEVRMARDSLSIVHASDCVMTFQERSNNAGDKKNPLFLDPWQFIIHELSEKGQEQEAAAVSRSLQQLEGSYPAEGPGCACRARLTVARHRGPVGHIPLYYVKAYHSLEPVDLGGGVQQPTFDGCDVRNVVSQQLRENSSNPITMNVDIPRNLGPNKKVDPETEPPTSFGLDWVYLTGLDEARSALQDLVALGGIVGIDIETYGHNALDPHRSTIRLLQLAADEGPVTIIDVDAVGGLSRIADLLGQLHGVAHNAKFEMKFFKKNGLRMVLDCTLLAHHVLTAEIVNLKELANIHLGLLMDKSEQRSDWGAPILTESQLRYAALDAYVPCKIFPLILKKLQEAGSELSYQITRDAQLAVVDMELTGMPFDTGGHASLVERLSNEYSELERRALKCLNGINPKSTKQIGEWIRKQLERDAPGSLQNWPKTGRGALRVGESDLKQHSRFLPLDVQSIVSDVLLPFKRVAKLKTTYGVKLQDHVHPRTHRIHGNFNLAGTRTGRMSSSSPNMQNLPRGDFRTLFRAPASRSIVKADLSQAELRVIACLANANSLLEAFRKGDDIHRKTASAILAKNVEDVSDEERRLAKALNFGLIYGQGPEGLMRYASSMYGVSLSMVDAKRYRAAWFSTYPEIESWHQYMRSQSGSCLSVRTPAGRIRYFRSGEYKPTLAYNTPVQGGAAEVILKALAFIERRLYSETIDAHIVAAIHDEVVVETPGDAETFVGAIVSESMREAMQCIFPEAPLEGLVDVSIGESWG